MFEAWCHESSSLHTQSLFAFHKQPLQMPRVHFLYLRFRMANGTLGGVYLLNHVANILNRYKGLKTKDHILYHLCQEISGIISMEKLEAQRQWYVYEEAAAYC